ncbi:sensor histidine kinase [Pedobacter cryoconitis]|uniref:histidine kinase n=1 Tax=Pedobacter cryoconitis TaxID=188932 RepID=A0A327T262_9SPHI|nr:HAMP domain-containing sensor histidine kinase [Pedobacter cryoconitis]RAJ35756.1 phospho-acceptor domain-containing protein [Pedobacter cryoconitis]
MRIINPVLSKKIFITFLAFFTIIAISVFYLDDSMRRKLKHISKISESVMLDQVASDQAMLRLHQTEVFFQKSFLDHYDSKTDYKIKVYHTQLLQVFDAIDSVIRKKPETEGLSAEQVTKMWNWYSKKGGLSTRLYLLKNLFDNLLIANLEANLKNRALSNAGLNIHMPERNPENYTGILKKVKSNKNKTLFGRIKDAIVNKSSDSDRASTLNNKRISEVVDSVTRKIIVNDKYVYEKKLKQLQLVSVNVIGSHKKLIVIHTEINDKLESIINDSKEISYKMQREFNYSAFKSLKETTLLINKFFIAAILMILIFAVLLIEFLIKLHRSEEILLMKNEQSMVMAKQKMDLLLYMSHEVRHPLTAIRSFLHLFAKAGLSPAQIEMLESIRFSSDMLLHTLSDTLDAAKLESSEIRINNAPFNPNNLFSEVVEGLGYGAVKKDLKMDYHFKGDEHAIVLGDALRLKQVLYNLLSNAVKYTKVGGVKINANLLSIKGNYILYVDITDTGEGISCEQQVNLFSKYHQTNSALGKIGTGLGLYICKLLVEMQEGKINMTNSVIGKGSTFSFYIPYE